MVNELQGEKIDIVNWSEDPAVVVSNALSPAEIQRVNVDTENKKLDVILTDENLSKAIGRRGHSIASFNIIYEVLDHIKNKMSGFLSPDVEGEIVVSEKNLNIIGSIITN